ncbi:MAG TPA: GntR family transcriptional regulator [Solirubrobacteraceae bacterium]|nr:GntR family transcriptional regulator [Solirubrobacteraceae bacterium]
MSQDLRDRATVEIGERIVTGRLPAGAMLDESALAAEVGVERQMVREALCFLQRDGFVRDAAGGGFAVSRLDEVELRETYPVVLLLEGLAVRTTPAFPPDAIARLREINADMERDGADAAAAAMHDFRFHEELVRHCANEQLLSTLRPLKRRMLRYELAYMAERRNVGRSVGQHAEIVDALERGDRDAAAATVEANFRDALPGLLDRLDTTG